MTYRWAAMGTLLAYSAIGVTKVAAAFPLDERKEKDGAPAGPQALVVRRFAIAPGCRQRLAQRSCTRAKAAVCLAKALPAQHPWAEFSWRIPESLWLFDDSRPGEAEPNFRSWTVLVRVTSLSQGERIETASQLSICRGYAIFFAGGLGSFPSRSGKSLLRDL